MPADILIRRAVPSDSHFIFDLIQELAVFERAPNEVITTPEQVEQHGWGTKPLFVCWIAELAGKPVGMALCYTRYSTWKGPVLYLEDLIVQEAHRGRGAGKQLFQTCLDHAAEHGFSRLSWQVLEWNEAAMDFYRQYGANFDSEWVNCSIDISNEPVE
jgi:GNAT superfamily N-acetyltransferase